MGKVDNHQCQFYFVCKDSDCLKKGAKKIYKELKHSLKEEKLFRFSRVVKTKCMGGCKNAPVAFIGHKWHAEVQVEDVPKLVKKLKKTLTN